MTIYAVLFAEKKSKTLTIPLRFFMLVRFFASSINRFNPRLDAAWFCFEFIII